MAIVFALTVSGAVLLLGLAVWPGVLEDAAFQFPLFCLSAPLLGGWFLLLIGLALADLAQRSETRKRRRWGLRSAVVMFATMGLLWLHVPQRIIFAPYASDLEAFVSNAPAGEDRTTELGRQFGPYWVDRYSADPRGGVFFRTHDGPDGIGPDTMSYGFAFQPNRDGTPFGDAKYLLRHLFGDWYAFAASND